jgi:hypothetical protein
MTEREISDTLAAALFGLCEVLTEPPSRSGYIADGYRHGNAMNRAKKALAAYKTHITSTTPCTPSSQDPN